MQVFYVAKRSKIACKANLKCLTTMLGTVLKVPVPDWADLDVGRMVLIMPARNGAWPRSDRTIPAGKWFTHDTTIPSLPMTHGLLGERGIEIFGNRTLLFQSNTQEALNRNWEIECVLWVLVALIYDDFTAIMNWKITALGLQSKIILVRALVWGVLRGNWRVMSVPHWPRQQH